MNNTASGMIPAGEPDCCCGNDSTASTAGRRRLHRAATFDDITPHPVPIQPLVSWLWLPDKNSAPAVTVANNLIPQPSGNHTAESLGRLHGLRHNRSHRAQTGDAGTDRVAGADWLITVHLYQYHLQTDAKAGGKVVYCSNPSKISGKRWMRGNLLSRQRQY